VRSSDSSAFFRMIRLPSRSTLCPYTTLFRSADFKHLNAQIGAYETYDDELYGTKAFYSLSVLARRPKESEALVSALAGLQAFERSEEHTSELQSREKLVCRPLLEKKKT